MCTLCASSRTSHSRCRPESQSVLWLLSLSRIFLFGCVFGIALVASGCGRQKSSLSNLKLEKWPFRVTDWLVTMKHSGKLVVTCSHRNPNLTGAMFRYFLGTNPTPLLHGGVAVSFRRPYPGTFQCNDTNRGCKGQVCYRPRSIPRMTQMNMPIFLWVYKTIKPAKDVVSAAGSELTDVSPRPDAPCSTDHPVLFSFLSGSVALTACQRRLSRSLVSWSGNTHPTKRGSFT
jgi:hypothetical protein